MLFSPGRDDMPVEFNFNHLSGAVGTKCLPGSILSKIVVFKTEGF